MLVALPTREPRQVGQHLTWGSLQSVQCALWSVKDCNLYFFFIIAKFKLAKNILKHPSVH